MSTVFEAKPQSGQNLAEMSNKLEFQKRLQAVTNKIHATSNIDEIMLELSQDICALFDADRLTIYVLSEDKTSIISKVKTGLSSFKYLKLPLNEHSIAGFVALSRKLINIRDVYDDNELRSHNPNLRFLKEVDKRTGYRTKQMLVVPVIDSAAARRRCCAASTIIWRPTRCCLQRKWSLPRAQPGARTSISKAS